MRTSAPIKQKRIPPKRVSRDIHKVSHQSSNSHIVKKRSSPHRKKLKLYAKKVTKKVLLSPIFHSTFRVISAVIVLSVILYASYIFIGRTFANEVVVSQSEIIRRVGILTALPYEKPYDVVRVQDEENLKKQNPFYKDVKEGDYILMYKNMAVIYDLRNNSIVALKRSGN